MLAESGSARIAPESNLARAVILSTLVMDINWTPEVTTDKLVSLWFANCGPPIRNFSGRKSKLKTAEEEAGKEPIRAL
jgi:hypothetical protein